MPITLTVNNIPYEYPVPGDSPGWGQPATDWATEVTLVLNELQGSTDIVQTPFTIVNNTTSFSDILGLNFNTGLVRAAFIDYSIYRTSSVPASPDHTFGFAECGCINIVYDNLAPVNSKWSMVVYGVAGDSGVTFTITDAGQLQYKSSNIGTTTFNTMRFRARTLNQ